MDTTAWIVTIAGLVAMGWVIWYFWIYEEPVASEPDEKSKDLTG